MESQGSIHNNVVYFLPIYSCLARDWYQPRLQSKDVLFSKVCHEDFF